MRLASLGEPASDNDQPAADVDLQHTRLVEGQEDVGVELEHVVRHARRDFAHAPEIAPSLLLDAKPDQVGHVERALRGSAEIGPANAEDGAPLDGAIEQDHDSPARPLRGDDTRLLAVDEEQRPGHESRGILARLLDDEGAVEAVRSPDAADADELRHRRRSTP